MVDLNNHMMPKKTGGLGGGGSRLKLGRRILCGVGQWQGGIYMTFGFKLGR